MTVTIRRFLFATLGMMLSVSAFASGGGSMFPHIEEPEGKKCVQPEDEMRRNHMNYIMHQRDETMHRGIRANIENEGYSLAECIDCHIYPDEKGELANYDEKEHFCNACHQYASVQIDCFGCHADKPQKYIQRGNENASLKEQLKQTLVSTANDGGEQ